MLDFSHYLPYAVAFVIAIPFLILIRHYIYTSIMLKEKEINLLVIKSGAENKLQAYERMTLFLERIKPANLVNQFDKGLKIHEFLFLINKIITEEFNYNSSQQLYISKNSWKNITNTKNNIIELARDTYEKLGENANLEDFKTIFLMNYMKEDDYISDTIEDLRREALILGK